MVGVISKWEVLAHPWVTIQCFGWSVFFRAVFSRSDQTFLSLLNQAGTFQQAGVLVPEFLRRCIALERRASQIYQLLAYRYRQTSPAREFFHALAVQEDLHAEMLELCRAAAIRGRWKERGIERWQEALPETEQELDKVEASMDRYDTLADSLRAVIRLEASQINRLFTGAVTSTDARFAQVYAVFRTAIRDHLHYLRERIPALEPSLAAECEQLQTQA